MTLQQNLLTVPQGQFRLTRLPKRERELLQAFDAADEYLLTQLAEQQGLNNASVLILNDSFGALAVALSAYQPYALSDSYLSQQATLINLAENGLPCERVTLLSSLAKLPKCFDTVLLKLPKNLGLLEDQLLRLRPYLTPSSRIIAAGMVKHIPSSVWRLFETIIGPTETSPARKKARLISVAVNPQLALPSNPYPVYYRLENTALLIANHANVFSRDKLDIGTRFFLQYLPTKSDANDIIDLGCGNGVLGLLAAQLNPHATVCFIDESFMALASAEENFRRAYGTTKAASFIAADGLTTTASHSADLILCNPPFHQQTTVGDAVAVSMFQQAKRVLRNNGELWVVGNRHLNYHQVLKRFFNNVELVASNAKFVINTVRHDY